MSKLEESAESPVFHWVDPGLPPVRADICQVLSSREETMLLFGTRQQPFTDDEKRATLDRRIVLRPSLAKELALSLRRFVNEREALSDGVNATPAGQLRYPPGEEDAPVGARPLLQLVQNLEIDFGFEKSLKLGPGSALADRMILGVRSTLADPEALLGICRKIGMPPAHLDQFAEFLPAANTIGFGYEDSPQGAMYKVYLEFWEKLRNRVETDASPDLLFLGFKWDAGDPARAAVARYTCYPLLTISGISRRLEALYGDHGDSPSLLATQQIIELASRRIGNDSFVYVEAAEEGNPRKSFDINFYKAGLRVSDMQAVLVELCRRYRISALPAQVMTGQTASRPFGHLSGGLGRDGKDFLTLYYELEGL
jgi:tryptophan halogenase